MLAIWREWQFDSILNRVYEKGIVLGGVSAGSICWFEQGVTDSISGSFTALTALGFLKGSSCPHYDGEVQLRRAYHQLLREEKISAGIEIDDCVTVYFVDGLVVNIAKILHNAHVYTVFKNGQEVKEKVIW